MEKNDLKPQNERETKIFLLGELKGLNSCRLSVWGSGYDKDDTGNMVRKFTCERIDEITEILQLSRLIDHSFSSVEEFVKKLEEKL